MRRFESEFALHLLNKIQIADRDGFRPASNTLHWSDPALAFSSKPRIRSDESIRGKVILMLTSAENEMLTRVSAGQPAGELLRRYWLPVGVACELSAENPT